MQISFESCFIFLFKLIINSTWQSEICSFRNYGLTRCFAVPFDVNLNTLCGPSKLPSSFTSTISGIFRRAQRNLVFHVEGSGWSPCRYFPVCCAQRLKSSAWVSRTNSGLSTRTQGTLNSPFSLSIHTKPSIPPRLICSSNHGVKRCRSFGSPNVASRLTDRSSDETCILDNILGFLQFRAMSYFRITTQFKRF